MGECIEEFFLSTIKRNNSDSLDKGGGRGGRKGVLFVREEGAKGEIETR